MVDQKIVYIFWSSSQKAEAQEIIQLLLNQDLIACASVFPEVQSIYRWEGKTEQSTEVKVIFKTTPHHFKAIEKVIKSHCSYKVPEIVQINIDQGSSEYLSWVIEETNPKD